jgi:hypothetical protein
MYTPLLNSNLLHIRTYPFCSNEKESDGKGAAKVLVWLRNEQAALEGGEASVTGKKRGLEDAAMTSDVSWSSMFKPFVLK